MEEGSANDENSQKEERVVEANKDTPEPEIKRGKGRPRKTDEHRTNFNALLSDSQKDMIDCASKALGLSMTEYIVMLVENDYEDKKDYYELVKKNRVNRAVK